MVRGRPVRAGFRGSTKELLSTNAVIPRMEAYVILEGPSRRIITDAKFYRHTFGAPVADVRLEGFRLQARSIDLAKDWRDIHIDMLALIA